MEHAEITAAADFLTFGNSRFSQSRKCDRISKRDINPAAAKIANNCTSERPKKNSCAIICNLKWPPSVGFYAENAISASTREAVQSDIRLFEAWGGTIPATPEAVSMYISAHARQLSVATLKRRLASISTAHQLAGHKSPTADPLVRRTMQGIRRIHGKPQKQAKPLTVVEITTIVGAISDNLTGLRDRALILLGFAGAFRRSELVGLDVRDLAFTAVGIRIVIRRSKTDPYGEGRIVDVPASGELTCPVAAVREWLERAAISKGPLFRPIDRHGNLGSSALTSHAVANILKRRAEAIGIDPKSISGHSLRAGYATSAATAGHTAWAIRQQTGHRSDEMVARYVRLAGNEEQGRPPLL